MKYQINKEVTARRQSEIARILALILDRDLKFKNSYLRGLLRGEEEYLIRAVHEAEDQYQLELETKLEESLKKFLDS